MAKHVIQKSQTNTVIVTDSWSEWLVAKGTLLSGAVGLQNYDNDFVGFTIAGKISSSYAGIQSLGDAGTGGSADGTTVVVTATGKVSGEQGALQLAGNDTSLTNLGKISSSETALNFEDGDITIENSGSILSQNAAAIEVDDTTGFLVRNDGLIATLVDGYAIDASVTDYGKLINGADGVINGMVRFSLSTGDITIVNKGEIAGDLSGDGVTLGSGDDRLVNRGSIDGHIYLGTGDDTIDLRKGEFTNPIVQGGVGNDVFILDDASILIKEYNGLGNDTIKTTVSYALGNTSADDIETLTAIGKSNIALTGNEDSNILNGNRGDNKLSGNGGADILLGLGGNDLLTGGDGTDHFYFYKKGGVDTIADFTIDVDMIHILEIPGIEDFDDLKSHFTTADFNDDNIDDTVIDLGGGSKIRLAGVDKDSLDMGDFSIFA